MDDPHGGPAFPVGTHNYDDGMSLRDFFAAHALIGILGSRNGFLVDVGTESAPEWAYRVADGMLAQRKKEPVSDEFDDDETGQDG